MTDLPKQHDTNATIIIKSVGGQRQSDDEAGVQDIVTTVNETVCFVSQHDGHGILASNKKKLGVASLTAIMYCEC